MRILLVRPRWKGVGRTGKVKLDVERIPPLALGILASLSPGEEVRIVNEDQEPVPFGERFDLVGITVHCFTARRSYEIADRFRKQGAKVVLGGVHPTLLPDEAAAHADSVVVGDGEPVWKRLLSDLARGRLGDRYVGLSDGELAPPAPARHLFRPARHLKYVQLTRGCGNTCAFCYQRGLPKGVRRRPIGDVLAEIRSFPDRIFFVTDDNLFFDRDYALAFLREMRGFGRHFWCEAPTTIGSDPEVLAALRAAGCFSVTLGFQSLDAAVLDGARVRQNRASEFREIVRRIHEEKMFVEGFFVFGLDGEGKDAFPRTLEFVRETGLDGAVLHILTPIPGTPLFDELRAAGRITSLDWDRYDWDHCVFEPTSMTAAELEAGVSGLYTDLGRWFRKTTWRKFLPNLEIALKSPALARFLVSTSFRLPA